MTCASRLILQPAPLTGATIRGSNCLNPRVSSDTKKLFNQLYKDYKQSISAYYKEREHNLKQNLENRLAIIEEIKDLLSVEENMGSTYKTFKELQEKWRNAGINEADWDTYDRWEADGHRLATFQYEAHNLLWNAANQWRMPTPNELLV